MTGFDADHRNAMVVKLVRTGDPQLFKIEIGSRFKRTFSQYYIQSVLHMMREKRPMN